MGRRAALARQRILRPGRIDDLSDEDGFTLLEIVCVLAIIGILAAIALPAIPRATSRVRLEGYTVEVATLLRVDRDTAIRQRRPVATQIDAPTRSLRSGATGLVVRIPDDVRFEAILATRCNRRPAGRTIDFFASGMSCGGTIRLMRQQVGYDVRVNWLTGGIEIVANDAL